MPRKEVPGHDYGKGMMPERSARTVARSGDEKTLMIQSRYKVSAESAK